MSSDYVNERILMKEICDEKVHTENYIWFGGVEFAVLEEVWHLYDLYDQMGW